MAKSNKNFSRLKLLHIALLVIVLLIGVFVYNNYKTYSDSNNVDKNLVKYTSPVYNALYTEEAKKSLSPDRIPPDVQFSILYPKDWRTEYNNSGIPGKGFSFSNERLGIQIVKNYPEGCYLQSDNGFYKTITYVESFQLLMIVMDTRDQSFIACAKEKTGYATSTKLGEIQVILPQNYKEAELKIVEESLRTLKVKEM